MKYHKNEAKEAARDTLKGVWTAMPYTWDSNDEFDETANRANMEHIISGLQIDGHYCSGNIAEFWSMPDEERMHAHEVMLDQASGRIPLSPGVITNRSNKQRRSPATLEISAMISRSY